jgi:hypothetical protein
MSSERIDRQSNAPRLSWFWGILLLLVVVQVGVILPAVALFLLGGNPSWAPAVMIGGLLVAWTMFITILRAGQRRAWWK